MAIQKITIAALGAASLLAFGTLQAQDAPSQPPGKMDVSRVEAGSYETDSEHSLVGWRANHFGINDYFGIFGNVEGTLELDPANLSAAKVDVLIPIASVVTASAMLNGQLLAPGKDVTAPKFFGPEPAPAHFVSTSVEPTGETSANITGDLTLNGMTHPVTIAANFTGAGDHPFTSAKTVGFEGTAAIKRSQFGISGYIPMVSDDVALNITVAFEKL